ncbi:MAG TPA: ABC transporter permease [Ktedonobacterales bacterium]|nr:ABC transporter permease [Ktedonobacterales bacterium]
MNPSITLARGTVRAARGARPSFVGIVRGELFKVGRQRATWLMAALLIAILCLPYLFASAIPDLKTQIVQTPLDTLYAFMGTSLMILRIFSGLFLILVTSRLIGMEYSGGTIRILLARGVGRLQLLAAKLVTLALVALGILVGGIVLDTLVSLLLLRGVAGNLDILKSLDASFWADTGVYIETVMLSMALTILMAAAVTVVTRSLAGGLAASMSWFPADNIGTIFFLLGFRLTNNTFWTLITGDFLGPNINVMPVAVLPQRAASAATPSQALATPLVPVSGGHTLLVCGLYAALFLGTMIVLIWKRDVQE